MTKKFFEQTIGQLHSIYSRPKVATQPNNLEPFSCQKEDERAHMDVSKIYSMSHTFKQSNV